MVVGDAPQMKMIGVHPYKAVCFIAERLCTAERVCKAMLARQVFSEITSFGSKGNTLLQYQNMALHDSMLMQAKQACMQHCSAESSTSSLQNASAVSYRKITSSEERHIMA